MSRPTSAEPASAVPALLGTAIEKLLFLESRLEAAEAARVAAERQLRTERLASTQARHDLRTWQRRANEARWAAQGAEHHVQHLQAELEQTRHQASLTLSEPTAEVQALKDELERLQLERALWHARLTDYERVRMDDDGVDLASYIADIRGGIMALRRAAAAGEPLRVEDIDAVAARPLPITRLPQRLEAAERVLHSVSAPVELDVLVEQVAGRRSHRTLARLCAGELRSGSAMQRRRGAERLTQAGIGSLNAWVRAQLPGEPAPDVRQAYWSLLAGTSGQPLSMLLPRPADPDPQVRARLVDLLADRGEGVEGFLHDPAAVVRRRVLGRWPVTDAALSDVLAAGLCDPDASVRKVAVLRLAGLRSTEARALLQSACSSADPEVAQEACRVTGQRPSALSPEPAEPTGSLSVDGLRDDIVTQVRMSLRGVSADELARRVGGASARLTAEVDALTAEGTLVWRGARLYSA